MVTFGQQWPSLTMAIAWRNLFQHLSNVKDGSVYMAPMEALTGVLPGKGITIRTHFYAGA